MRLICASWIHLLMLSLLGAIPRGCGREAVNGEQQCSDLQPSPSSNDSTNAYEQMTTFKTCNEEIVIDKFCAAVDEQEAGESVLILLSKIIDFIDNQICDFLHDDSVCFFNGFEKRDAYGITQNLTRIYSKDAELRIGTCFCCCRNNPPGECANAVGDRNETVALHKPKGGFCGVLRTELVGTNVTILNITEESGYTTPFFQAIQVLTKDGEHFIDVVDDCEISICGVRHKLFSYEKIWQCFTYNETSTEYNFTTKSNFDMASISCGCAAAAKQLSDMHVSDPEPACQSAAGQSCELYQEERCQSRKHKVVIITDSQDFATEHASVIRSIALHDDCTLRATAASGQSINYTSKSNPEIHMYYPSDSDFALSPFIHFGCSCSSPNSNAFPTVVIVIVSVGLTVLIAVGVTTAIQVHKRKKRLRLTAAEVQELSMELFRPKSSHNNVEGETASTNMLLQFDAKFEVKRADIQCSKTDTLGRGNFGLVYRGRFCPSKMEPIDVAVKTIDEHAAQITDLKAFINEIRIMAHIGAHANIVLFIGAHCSFHPTKWEILSIMELCEESLYDHLNGVFNQQHKKPSCDSAAVFTPTKGNSHYLSFEIVSESITPSHSISEEEKIHLPPTTDLLIKWSADIAHGMEFLATKNVLHIDLATRNILLAKDLTAKICDFGLSRKLYEKTYYQKQKTNDTLWLPLKWTAIETFNDFKFSAKSDIWAYGVTVWEIFSLAEEPYQGIHTFMELVAFLNSGRRLPRPYLADEETYKLLTKCWEFNTASRPSFAELRTFFSNAHKRKAFL